MQAQPVFLRRSLRVPVVTPCLQPGCDLCSLPSCFLTPWQLKIPLALRGRLLPGRWLWEHPGACSPPAVHCCRGLAVLRCPGVTSQHLPAVGSCFRSSQAVVFPGGGAHLVQGNPSAMKLVVLGLGAEPSCRRMVRACAFSTCWGSSSVCSSHGCMARAMGDCVGSCWVPSAVPPSLPGALLAPCLHTRVSTGMVPELSPGWNLFGLAVTMSFGAVVVRRGSLGQPLIS